MDPIEFKKLKFAIRNLEQLTNQQINNIKSMSVSQKDDIIMIYIQVVRQLLNYVDMCN